MVLMQDDGIARLLAFAKSLGVADARLLEVERIEVDDRFRHQCEEPRCVNYNTSANCPPHSMTPGRFREHIKGFTHILAFKFDMPQEAVMGINRREAGLLLHETTAAIEHQARSQGFHRACGYSSGGCKQTLCHEHSECAALQDRHQCRHSETARPSLSGMGLNWYELSKSLGWEMQKSEDGERNPKSETTMMAGLVFLE